MTQMMILAEGGLSRMKEMVGMLKRKGVSSEILPPADGCVSGWGTKYRLAVASEVLKEAIMILQPPEPAPVVDFNQEEMTCPACMHTFATGPKECPDCGLFLG